MPSRNGHNLTPYQQKLLDPRWQKKRLEILQRDDWKCRHCFAKDETLHVHHQYYDRDTDPWEYPSRYLVTLCATCHEEETTQRPLEEQYIIQVLKRLCYHHEDVRALALSLEEWLSSNTPESEMWARLTALHDIELVGELSEKYWARVYSTVPVQEEKKKRSKKQPLLADDWLSIWLKSQDILEIPFEFLNDKVWWAAASFLLTDGLNQPWLEKQFAEMRMRFQQPDTTSPRTEAGWKRFLKSWFKIADQNEQRAKRREKLYGTTN